MNYNFKYKYKNPKRTFAERKNKVLSDLLYFLYRSKLFKLLKLDNDLSIRTNGKYETPPKKYIEDFEFEGVQVHSVLFSDVFLIENLKKYKRQILRVIRRNKMKPHFLQKEARKVFSESFDNMQNKYSTVSYGTIYSATLPERNKFDLIKSISIGYIKGEESSLIPTYKVYPSQKFNDLLKKCMEDKGITEYEVLDVSLKDFFRIKKGYYSGHYVKSRDSQYWTGKLFDELNHQVKNVVLGRLKVGVFKTNKKVLFPYIATYEFENEKDQKFERRFHRNINHFGSMKYEAEGLKLIKDRPDFERNSSHSISILLKKRKPEELDNGLNSIDYVSKMYIDQILPKFILTNLSALNRIKIVKFRNRIFKRLRKKTAPLFLRRVLRLKNKLTISSIDFNRVSKDVLEDERLFENKYEDTQIPEAFGDCGAKNCSKKHEFTQELNKDCKESVEESQSSYSELTELFQSISDDNLSRSNMRLQLLLFLLAIFGIILTIYGTHVSEFDKWFMTWFD